MAGLLKRLAEGDDEGVGCGGLSTDTGIKGFGAVEAWVLTGWNAWRWYVECWVLGGVRPHFGCRFDQRAVEGYGARDGW